MAEPRQRRLLQGERCLSHGCRAWRQSLGVDVAVLEALRGYWRRRGKVDKLPRYAEICRVVRVFRPYLEAVS